MIPLYLVEYPFAIGAWRRVSERSNRLNLNGCDPLKATISGPTGLASTSDGGWELLIIPVVRRGRAGRRSPHAERAVVLPSSPEPAARWRGSEKWEV